MSRTVALFRLHLKGPRDGSSMRTTTSADGTTIAYDRIGHGPPLIVVAGALQGRATYRPAAESLARYFTVINYDRRGRGDSTDCPPYAVEREIDDLAALIEVVGGSAAVYGHSSGSALAFAAAAEGLPITGLVVHEPPFGSGSDEEAAAERAEAAHIADLLQRCARAEAVRYFFSSMGLPAEFVEPLAADPTMRAHAPTLLYDYAVLASHVRSGRSLTEQALRVKAPTLVLVGGSSYDFIAASGKQILDGLVDGQLRVLDGHDHVVPADVLAPIVAGFVFRKAAA
jgi:pimeloyl-ACP methyl ester carboxylesterase